MGTFLQLVKKEIYRFMSVWVQTIIAPVSTALLYQLIFGSQLAKLTTDIPGVSYNVYLIPGLIMMQVLINAFSNGSSSLMQSKYTGNIIFLLMAPITPFAFYGAYLVSSIIRGVIVGIAVALSIVYFGMPSFHNIYIAIYYMVIGAAITAGFGLIAGILSEKFDQLASFQSFVIVPLVYLAGVFFNPKSLSPFMQKLSSLDPFLYIIDGFRYGLIGGEAHNLLFEMFIVLVFAIMVNAWGYILIARGVKIRQ